jgi:hypothetical protein
MLTGRRALCLPVPWKLTSSPQRSGPQNELYLAPGALEGKWLLAWLSLSERRHRTYAVTTNYAKPPSH